MANYKDLEDGLAKGVYDGKYDPYHLPNQVYFFNARKLVRGLYKGFGKNLHKIKYNDPDYKLLESLRENLYMFSGAKTFQQTMQMSEALTEGDKVLPFNEFKDRVSQINELFNETYLATEYNTAIASAQNASSWQRFEREKKILPLLRYSTVEKACEICTPLDGLTLPVGDPKWDTVAPENHFNCRCLLEQYEEGEIEPTDSELADEIFKESTGNMDDMFKNNSGKSGEVFNKEHGYFSIPRQYKEFAKDNFGLPIPELNGDN